MAPLGGADAVAEILERWETVLTGLESDPMQLADQLDWVAKKKLLDRYRDRDGMEWDDARLRLIDLQYADMRPHKSVFARVGMQTLVTHEEAERAVFEPPEETRAYFRGKCLQQFATDIVAANWDSLVFDVGDEPLRRVPMMEPGRGTRAHVGSLLEDCDSALELLRRLDGNR